MIYTLHGAGNVQTLSKYCICSLQFILVLSEQLRQGKSCEQVGTDSSNVSSECRRNVEVHGSQLCSLFCLSSSRLYLFRLSHPSDISEHLCDKY